MSNQTNDDYDMNLSWSDDPDDVPSLKNGSDDFAGEMSDGVVAGATEDTEMGVSFESIVGEAKSSNEDEEEKKATTFGLVKTFSMMVLALVVLIFVSTAWFTMKENVDVTGMGFKVLTDRYIITSLDDTDNGVYYADYHSKIRENEDETTLVWQVKSGSHLNNIDTTGDNVGIGPGSKGVISFYVTPTVDTTVDITFNFETFGYVVNEVTGSGSGASGSGDYTVDEIDSVSLKNYLAGHILLFEEYNPNTGKYSKPIPLNGERKRVLSKSFTGAGVRKQVDIYWIWPQNLSNIVHIDDVGQEPICNYPSTDYNSVVSYVTSFPQFFLQGNWTGQTVREETIHDNYSTYGGYYDGADNDIGSGVEYVLLRMSTAN